jgi:hypothetical protein
MVLLPPSEGRRGDRKKEGKGKRPEDKGKKEGDDPIS